MQECPASQENNAVKQARGSYSLNFDDKKEVLRGSYSCI